LLFRIPKEPLRNEIQRLVKSYPLQVRHIPDALSIFTVTADNDRQCEVNPKIKFEKKKKKRIYYFRHLIFLHGLQLIPLLHFLILQVHDLIK
jgi:hypothetical protein